MMRPLTARRLRFIMEVRTSVELNEHQGAAMRGSLFHFAFRLFFRRLMKRLEDPTGRFSDTSLVFGNPRGLITTAERACIVENGLRRAEAWSCSTRRRGEPPTSGLVGTVALRAEDWSPFWPYLLWGQFTHVGEEAVKGNGVVCGIR